MVEQYSAVLKFRSNHYLLELFDSGPDSVI